MGREERQGREGGGDENTSAPIHYHVNTKVRREERCEGKGREEKGKFG